MKCTDCRPLIFDQNQSGGMKGRKLYSMDRRGDFVILEKIIKKISNEFDTKYEISAEILTSKQKKIERKIPLHMFEDFGEARPALRTLFTKSCGLLRLYEVATASQRQPPNDDDNNGFKHTSYH